MVQTSAQRQAKFRATRLMARDGDGERRLNMYILASAASALARLAARAGVTQKQMLEQLLLDADLEVCRQLAHDQEALKKYFEAGLRRCSMKHKPEHLSAVH